MAGALCFAVKKNEEDIVHCEFLNIWEHKALGGIGGGKGKIEEEGWE